MTEMLKGNRLDREKASRYGISRRELISTGAVATAGAWIGACRSDVPSQGSISVDDIIGATALRGERVSRERVAAHKDATLGILASIQAIREFDPGDEEPVPGFQV